MGAASFCCRLPVPVPVPVPGPKTEAEPLVDPLY